MGGDRRGGGKGKWFHLVFGERRGRFKKRKGKRKEKRKEKKRKEKRKRQTNRREDGVQII